MSTTVVKHKSFNGRKYSLVKSANRWVRTTGSVSLSHDVWNYYYPNDPILKDEMIHHKNGVSSDDRIENLQKMKFGKHNSLHHTGKHLLQITKQKISDALFGEKCYVFGKHLSDETKQKLREAKLGEKGYWYGKTGKEHPNFGKHCSSETKQKIRNTMLLRGGKKK